MQKHLAIGRGVKILDEKNREASLRVKVALANLTQLYATSWDSSKHNFRETGRQLSALLGNLLRLKVD